jgi:hypothetical protein
MRTWEGWLPASAMANTFRLTWDKWCALQRRQEGIPFSDRELARLSFVRWLYHNYTRRLDLAEVDNG